ncbi:MAG: calcium-binding protein [Acidimicrobiia bacterium]
MGDDLDDLIEEVIVDAYGEDEQLWSFRQVFEEDGRFPFSATMVGAALDVTGVDYEGDERRGLLAQCRRDGKIHRVLASRRRPGRAAVAHHRPSAGRLPEVVGGGAAPGPFFPTGPASLGLFAVGAAGAGGTPAGARGPRRLGPGRRVLGRRR